MSSETTKIYKEMVDKYMNKEDGLTFYNFTERFFSVLFNKIIKPELDADENDNKIVSEV
jgi:hypothetical protein